MTQTSNSGIDDNDDASSNKDQQQQQKVSQFSEIATKLVDKLLNKDVSVTYTFNNLEIEVPSAHGPGGKELGGGKWIIDGKINISTKSTTHDREPQSGSSKYMAS